MANSALILFEGFIEIFAYDRDILELSQLIPRCTPGRDEHSV